MSGWIPPADGSPCWIEIPVLDVARAKTFYGATLDWSFRDISGVTGFTFPDQRYSSLSGGFKKVDQIRGGDAAPRLYFYVTELENAMETIVANGGKKLSGIEPESDFGLMMYAEDTEGNQFAIYTMKNKA